MKPRDSSPFVQVFVNISTIFFMQFIEELIPKLKLHLMDGIVTWIENFFSSDTGGVFNHANYCYCSRQDRWIHK